MLASWHTTLGSESSTIDRGGRMLGRDQYIRQWAQYIRQREQYVSKWMQYKGSGVIGQWSR